MANPVKTFHSSELIIFVTFLVVSMYIQFLAHYAPDAGSDLADLCLDISSIIMERSTLLPAVLPGTLCKTPVKAANDTYAALLRLFIYFMGHVRRRADQPAATQWGQGEAQEHILVKWNSSNEKLTATIHFFIVHAQVSLYYFEIILNNVTHCLLLRVLCKC